MSAIRVISLIVLLCVHKVGSPPILEKFEDYPCPDGKQEYVIFYKTSTGMKLNISKCEQVWEFDKKSIADLPSGQCILPCLNVSSGEIHLAQCINATLRIECTIDKHGIEETRVHFHGKPSSSQSQRDPKEEHISTQEKNHHFGLIAGGIFAVFFCAVCCMCFFHKRQTSIQGPG